jgi:hypothetical protein
VKTRNLIFRIGNEVHNFEAKFNDRGNIVSKQFTAPISRVISSNDGVVEFLEKTVLDIEAGREKAELVFENTVYNVVRDRSLPRFVKVDVTANFNSVFLKHAEGQEVEFGTLSAGTPQVVEILEYTNGLEYTNSMVEYNENYNVEKINTEFGLAYNELKNKVEFTPILDVLENGTGTGAQGTAEDAETVRVNKTLQKGILDYKKKDVINKPVLIANSQDKFKIEAALEGTRISNGEKLADLRGEFEEIIYYDGHKSVKVGAKTYEFPGCPVGKVALVEPQEKAIVYEKQDLTIEAKDGDLSRLIENQVVGVGRFGVYIAAEDIVQKVTLP